MASTARQPQRTKQPKKSGLFTTLESKFSAFLNSLGDLLLDITALEVNTMVVSQITGEKFIPEEAYDLLYEIPPNPEDVAYFQQRGVPQDMALRSRYSSLRRKLDLQCQVLGDKLNQSIDQAPDPENPANSDIMAAMMMDAEFLRGLRKLSELLSAIDGGDVRSSAYDLIYAQTVIQLDGDIINRYHQQLMEHSHKQVIMQLHHEGVVSGEKQWHGLLDFMVNLVKTIVKERGSTIFSFPANDKPTDQ